MVGKVVEAAHAIRRQRRVNLFGVGQVEVVHDLDELLARLCQSRIEGFFLCDRGHELTLVVVGGIHPEVVVQAEDVVPHRVVEDRRVSLLEKADV
jgi:hypothetical protein